MRILAQWIPTILIIANSIGFAQLQQDSTLRGLTEAFWSWKLSTFPEFATGEGFHLHDDTLEEMSLEHFRYRWDNCSSFLQEANAIDPEQLTWNDQLTLNVLKDQLTTYTEGYKWRNYGNLNPVNFMEGVHRSLKYWVQSTILYNHRDYENYKTRLRLLQSMIDDVITLMRLSIELNTTYHEVSMVAVPGQLQAELINVSPEQTIFYEPLGNFPSDDLTDYEREQHHSEINRIIRTVVQPSFRKLNDFIINTYLPNCRPHYGIHSLAGGMEYYKALLRWHLSLDVEPMDIHQLGLEEVERIANNMKQLMLSLNFTGTIPQFFESMRNMQRFYNHSQDQMIQAYEHIAHNRINPRLSALFSNISAVPMLKVKPMPYDGVDAQYSGGTLWANTRLPHTKPSFVMMAIALHEGSPGHHLQVSLARMLPVPNFRRYIWGSKKFAAPFHFPYYTAYVEGWGLYAEYLGQEMGLFEDPYEMFGRYTFEMFRACRLVIDTGIHALGWDRDRAVEYMLNYTFTTPKQAYVEIDRYITWPGQACAYKFGEIQIKRIRKKAEDTLGSRFDIKAFHWQIIRLGFVPINVMEQAIDRWVAQEVANGVTPVTSQLWGTLLMSLMTSYFLIRRVYVSFV